MSKVVTGLVRFSYAHVFEPSAVNEGDTKKYSVSLIIPKKDKATISKVRAAIESALEAGKNSKFDGKIPKKYKDPLRDGDEEREDNEEYEDAYFINASSLQRPSVVDEDRNEILDKEEFYSGCYGRASVNFYAFNVSGNKGIACGLNHVQKLKDGDSLGSARTSADDDFADDLDDDLS